MGKLIMTPVAYDIFVAEISAEEYDELTDNEELGFAFDTEISNAVGETEYEFRYQEDK